MLGYDAYIMLYGSNAYMYSALQEKEMMAFGDNDINDFETIESDFDDAGGDDSAGGC